MKQEHQNWHIQTVNSGAKPDLDKEILGMNKDGFFVTARNARPTGMNGNSEASEKIKGEVKIYTAQLTPGTYVCNKSMKVNGDIVEIWCDINNTYPSLVRVNGVIVLKSTNFGYTYTNPIQSDVNENVVGGEIIITDFNIPPMILNVKDMVDSLTLTPDKYFANFDSRLYEVNLSAPLDMPIFVEMVNVSGGGGLPVGQYEYEIRYSTKDGDKTRWSQRTPGIPVVQNISNESEQYPSVKTYADAADPSRRTRYAIKLRFRVTNIFDYDYIEIKRVAHNQGAGIGFQPVSYSVAQIPIGKQEISVREFIDPADSNTATVITDSEDEQQIAHIEKARAVRYYDKRAVFMNVKLASKESDLEFLEINDEEMFPVIDKIGKQGFNDPWNHVYRKAYMGGEKYGFAVNLYDGVGNRSFSQKEANFTNYQYPNRRDTISTNTTNYSTGTVRASRSEVVGTVAQTHEVFDLDEAIQKTDVCSFKNIYRPRNLSLFGYKTKAKVTEDCAVTEESEIENYGARVQTGTNFVFPYYHPYTPVRQNDNDVTGHNYRVNPTVGYGGVVATPTATDNYTPKGFAPQYYSHGMGMAGIANFPTWAKAFSVVRTEAAGRVIAQGIGTYSMIPAEYKAAGNQKLTTKWLQKLWSFFPDIENGIVASDVVNDIIDNPENYQLQFVSPLGYFSEMYNFENNAAYAQRDRLVDMVTYARIIRDFGGNTINPGDTTMGITNGGYNYVTHGKFRNGLAAQAASGFPTGSDGNTLFDIASARRVSEGRGDYMEFETDNSIYGTVGTGGTFDNDFDQQGMKDWAEPFYIINIVANGVNVVDQNINKYKATTHYQKLESIIGKSNGVAGQSFQLVDERFEDCIPGKTTDDYNSSADRFLYIKKTDGSVETWMNVSYKSGGTIATINADIIANGFYLSGSTEVTGTYTHTNNIGDNTISKSDYRYQLIRFFNIVFNTGYTPPVDSLILVRYDNTAPIKFWGGDTFVGESLFAPIDREADAFDDAPDTQFAFGVGFPFRAMKLNPRHYVIKRTTDGVNSIQDQPWGWLGYLRQMCVMFTVESRVAAHLAFNQDYPLQFFPLINYVMRPNRWDADKTLEENFIYREYGLDYGEDEINQWSWGGFRFKQQVNFEYSNELPNEFFSKPQVGFEERTDFYTRIMWSLPRQVNAQNSPGLKTFPANNAFDIDDAQGAIKYAFDAMSGKGSNLYAITENGVCMLLTSKSILTDAAAGQIAYMSSDKFVQQEYWLSKFIGMDKENWRGTAEGFLPMVAQDGSQARVEGLIFINSDSVYSLIDNNLKDIGRAGFWTEVVANGIKYIQDNFQTFVCAVFDNKNQEFWLSIRDEQDELTIKRLFVYSAKKQQWMGQYDYSFDQFTAMDDYTVGHRDLETWKTDEGYLINGSPIVYEMLLAVAPEQFVDKEFIRVRVNSPETEKPTKISFIDPETNTEMCSLDISQGSLYLKNYRGWEQFIPRKNTVFSVNRPRVQGRLLLYKIIHDLESKFKVVDSAIQYKVLK